MTSVGRAPGRAQLWIGCALVAAGAALSGCQTPSPVVAPQEPPKAELSYLNIPVNIPLAPIQQRAEEEVPRSAGVEPFQYRMDGGAAPPACGIDGGYSITRGPLAMTGGGEAVITTIDVSYWLKGQKQEPCPGPVTTGSCGTDGEPPRTASASVSTEISIPPDLTTSVQSTVGPVAPGNRCVLHPLELDVTDSVVAGFDGALKKMLPAVDKRLAAALDLRKRAEASWGRMSEPTELRPNVWLALNPEGIGIMPVSASEGQLHTGIQLWIRPVVTAGKKPPSNPKPFPLANAATPADTFKLQIPVDVQESFVQARLEQALDLKKGGKTLDMSGHSVTITGADVYGEGSKVVIKLTLTGDLTGTAFLTGTPYYNSDTRQLSFPDLEYTLDTNQTLLSVANWFAQSQIRDALREKFTVDMTQSMERMKQGLESVLNRRRGNVQLHGSVEQLDLVGVYRVPNGDVFTAFLTASGKVSADVDLQ